MTEVDWWAQLNDEPASFPLLIFADWLGEYGDAREDAAREVAHRRWAPLRCASVHSDLPAETEVLWRWYRLASGAGKLLPIPKEVSNNWRGQLARAILPQEVFDALPGPSRRKYRRYATPAGAYRTLLTTLAGLGKPKDCHRAGNEL